MQLIRTPRQAIGCGFLPVLGLLGSIVLLWSGRDNENRSRMVDWMWVVFCVLMVTIWFGRKPSQEECGTGLNPD